MTASPRNEVARARRAAESVLALTSIALVAVCADACGKDEAKGTASNGGGAVTTTTTTTTGTGTGTTTGGHGGAGQGGATTTGHGGGQTTGQGGGGTTTTSTFTTTSSSTGDASLPPACTVGSKWSVVVGPAAVGTPDDDLMGSITPDELHIAWMTPDGAVRYADRVGPGMVFAGYQTLPATPGYFAVDRVALGAGGLELVAVTTSRKGFGVFSRQDPMGAFAGPPDSAPFAAIAAALGPNEQLGDPVIAPDGKTLFYSVFGAAPTTIKVATRSDPKQAWAPAGALDAPELQAVGNARRRPTGISSDLRTLFFWDETKSTEFAAWRPSPGAPFDTFLDIGPLFGATPGANCVGLYYSGWGVAPPPLPDGGILDGGLIPADAAPPLDSGSDAMPPPPDAAPPPPTLPPPPPPPNGEGDGPRDIFHAFPQ